MIATPNFRDSSNPLIDIYRGSEALEENKVASVPIAEVQELIRYLKACEQSVTTYISNSGLLDE